MTATGRFPAKTVETLAKRAAFLCSSPECGVLTSGPTDATDGAINIGEAAHIYGVMPGSARYNPAMTPSERCDITNGVWLCCNCHKKIDDDEQRFPPEVLFSWRREHEQAVLQKVGQRTDRIRDELKAERLKPFQSTSCLARQIAWDRPSYWEYKLTIELLRTELGAVHSKWRALREGLYVRRSTFIPLDQIGAHYRSKFRDAQLVVDAFKKLIEIELPRSWGPPGQPGNEVEILHACRLMVSAAENYLEWEEDIHFSRVPDEIEELRMFMCGKMGAQIEEMMRIPGALSKIFECENPTGAHDIQLTFRFPENFSEDFTRIANRCARRVNRSGGLFQRLFGT